MFCKLDGGTILEAPNFVHTPTTSLLVEDKDTYIYPVEGWYWFDTIEEAKLFFDVS